MITYSLALQFHNDRGTQDDGHCLRREVIGALNDWSEFMSVCPDDGSAWRVELIRSGSIFTVTVQDVPVEVSMQALVAVVRLAAAACPGSFTPLPIPRLRKVGRPVTLAVPPVTVQVPEGTHPEGGAETALAHTFERLLTDQAIQVVGYTFVKLGNTWMFQANVGALHLVNVVADLVSTAFRQVFGHHAKIL